MTKLRKSFIVFIIFFLAVSLILPVNPLIYSAAASESETTIQESTDQLDFSNVCYLNGDTIVTSSNGDVQNKDTAINGVNGSLNNNNNKQSKKEITALGTEANSVTAASLGEVTSGNYTYTVISETEKIACLNRISSYGYWVTIPSEIDGYKIIEIRNTIGGNIFATAPDTFNYDVQQVDIPEGVTVIGQEAFEGCLVMQEVNIPATVTGIEDAAFIGCLSLQNLTIPEGITHLTYAAFCDCRSLTSVNIPASVKFIYTYAFYHCLNLRDAYFYGNPPEAWGDGLFLETSPYFTIRYIESGTVGWTNPWFGYPTQPFDSDPVMDWGVTLNQHDLELDSNWIGEFVTATVDPIDATNQRLEWSSSNTSVAQVYPYDGTNFYYNTNWPGNYAYIAPVSPGYANIRVETANGWSDTCKVIVGPLVSVTGISLDKSSMSVELANPGDLSLTATITPSNATIKDIIWTSDNPSVAGVSGSMIDGTAQVLPYASGTAKITAATVDGELTASCIVTVHGLTVISTDPVTKTENYYSLPEAYNVPLNSKISITFNENIKPGSNFNEIKIIDQNNSQVPLNANCNGAALEITHAPFAEDHSYRLQVPDYSVINESGHGNTIYECYLYPWGLFTHSDAKGTGNFVDRYIYTDDYFKDTSYTYNHDLATMSLSLAMTAMGNADAYWSEQSDPVRSLLTDIGFKDFAVNEAFTKEPTPDSIGVAFANKDLNLQDGSKCKVIAVAVRSGGYRSEWASNFTIGNSGLYHQGFGKARDDVLIELNRYINDPDQDISTVNPITGKIKIWVTGFSRGAATANLVAGKLDSGTGLTVSNVSLSPADLYAYTFETPAGVTTEVRPAPYVPAYQNIFNIVNHNDPVPKVAPEDWRFTRYGKTFFLPSSLTNDNYDDLLDLMKSNMGAGMWSSDYIVDDFTMKKVDWIKSDWGNFEVKTYDDPKNRMDQGSFLEKLLGFLMNEEFVSAQNYVNDYQEDIRNLLTILNTTPEVKDLSIKYLSEDMDEIGKQVKQKLWDRDPIGAYTAASKIAVNDIYRALTECEINSYSKEYLQGVCDKVAILVVDSLIQHPNWFATAGENLDNIGQAHYPEVCLAWMKSLKGDSVKKIMEDKSYRTVFINCPVDVAAFDSKGNLAASIINDTPQTIQGSSIISSLDEDGQKVLYLPGDEEYTVRMTATGDGFVTYSVSEHSLSAGKAVRIVNFYKVKINNGDILTGTIDNLNTAANAGYTLTGNDGQEITASEDLAGADIQDYKVTVQIQGNGEALGQGTRYKGEFAQLTASPYRGSRFDGWYVNNEKVSSDSVYRFCVLADITVVANFVESDDSIPPVIEDPMDLTAEATSLDGAAVDFVEPNASDNMDGEFPAACSPASGSQFALGDTIVTCTATDSAGNAAIPKTFTVTVKDTTPPSISAPANIVRSIGGAIDIGQAAATDIFPVTISNNAPPIFSAGVTPVIWTAVDSNGNVSTAIQTVTVKYDFRGILRPFDTDGSNVFTLGSTIPIKFELKDADGQYVSDAKATISYVKTSDNTAETSIKNGSADKTADGNTFRFSENQYIYNLSTKGFTLGTYQILIKFDGDDNSVFSFNLSLQ